MKMVDVKEASTDNQCEVKNFQLQLSCLVSASSL